MQISLNDIDSMKMEMLGREVGLTPQELCKLVLKKFLFENYKEPSSKEAIVKLKLGEKPEKIHIQSFIEYYNTVWKPKRGAETIRKTNGESKVQI